MELSRELVVYQGDDLVHKVVLTHPDGSVFNIRAEGNDSLSYSSTIKKQGTTSLSPAGEEVGAFEWDDSDPNLLEQGIVVLTMSNTVSKSIPAGRHWYDVKQSDNSTPPIVLTLFSGIITVLPEATKSSE